MDPEVYGGQKTFDPLHLSDSCVLKARPRTWPMPLLPPAQHVSTLAPSPYLHECLGGASGFWSPELQRPSDVSGWSAAGSPFFGGSH